MWGNDANNTSMQSYQGGYMDTSIASTSNTSTEGRAANFNRGQNCVPMMICHLVRYKDNVHLWGMPVHIVTFVAILEKVDAVSTKVNFQFRDETGSIRGVKWLSAEVINYVPPVSINSYARIHGSMRNISNECFVNVNQIQPIEHLNELMAHLMEVTLLCLQGEKMIVQNQTESINQENLRIQDDGCPSSFTREQAIVYSIIKRARDEEFGAEREEIKSDVPADIVSKVDTILDFLSSEGHIYTTKTDDHFKVI